ncbi:hypothetical protein Mgra_00002380 [Meloidogyne graminicola]|uniref:Uncharacterized protein n=1 Tax=Meloidogyne graminicola TaxID=189291 RepID=A0A8S9ZYB4_9BILA|nr:hypothetical protein Mgra_00002380 [Meloidogyne graminicola]
MCNLAMEKCSEKGEKKKASCGGAAMRKRLLIKNFVAQMLTQEKQTRSLQQQQSSDGIGIHQNSPNESSSHFLYDSHLEREGEDEDEEVEIITNIEYKRVEVENEEDSDEIEEEEDEEEEETAVAALLASKIDKTNENSFRPRFRDNSDEENNFLLIDEEPNKKEAIINHSPLQTFSSLSQFSASNNYENWQNQADQNEREDDEFQKVPLHQNNFYSVDSGNRDIYNGSWHFYGGIDTSFDHLNGGLLTENLMINDQQNDKLIEEEGNTKLFLMERASDSSTHLIDEIEHSQQQHLVGVTSMVPYLMKFTTNEDHLLYPQQEEEMDNNKFGRREQNNCLTNLDNARFLEDVNNQIDIFETTRKRPWLSQSEWSNFEENNNGEFDNNHFEQHQQFSPLCCGFLQLQPFGNSTITTQFGCDSATTAEPLMKRVKL